MTQYQIPRLVPYGTIKRTHGHQGSFVIELHSEELLDADPEFIFIDIDGIPVPFHIEELRGTREQLITTVAHISSNEAAARLRGQAVWIGSDEAPKISSEDLSYRLLIGFRVHHISGKELGIIQDIDDSTANILIVIDQPTSDEPLLIPFVEEWISRLDSDKRELTIDFPIELLELS